MHYLNIISAPRIISTVVNQLHLKVRRGRPVQTDTQRVHARRINRTRRLKTSKGRAVKLLEGVAVHVNLSHITRDRPSRLTNPIKGRCVTVTEQRHHIRSIRIRSIRRTRQELSRRRIIRCLDNHSLWHVNIIDVVLRHSIVRYLTISVRT